MEIGDLIDLNISTLSFGGEGIGKYQGKVIFVPRTAPGDEITAVVIKDKKKFAFGKTVEIKKPSSIRRDPPCPHFHECGGCHLQHLPYKLQIEHKVKSVVDALERIGKTTPPEPEIISAPSEFFYRNRAYFHISYDAVGLKNIDGDKIVNIDKCMIIDKRLYPPLVSLTDALEEFKLKSKPGDPLPISAASIRVGTTDENIHLTLITEPALAEKAMALVKILPSDMNISINIKDPSDRAMFGKEWKAVRGSITVKDSTAGLLFETDPEVFFQVNPEMAEKLVHVAMDMLSPASHETIVDLYCGAGCFTLPAAKRAKRAVGVDLSRKAVESAEKSASLNNIKNASFLTGKAARMFRSILKKGISPHSVLIDPPRAGMEKGLADYIGQSSVKKIVYISCSPPTLARDAALLTPYGFSIYKLVVLDMFPQTYHIESAVLFIRR